jgi:parvulin-like peptidyl-prolyl isomerase
VNVESGKVSRRRRKTPTRRVPAIVEQRQKKPFLFGWGTELTQREREGLKERIALLAGIVLALVVGGLIAWGLIHDNVIVPAQQSARNNEQVAVVGNNVIRLGFYKRFEAFQNSTYSQQIQVLQQQEASINQSTAQGKAQVAQINQQLSSLNQALTNLPTVTLDQLINEEIALQKAGSAGVMVSKKELAAALTQQQHNQGGPLHFQQFLTQSNLSLAEFTNLLKSQLLESKLQPALAAKVAKTETKVRASHILITASKLSLAKQLLKQAQQGANFAALAKKYSTDPGSAKKGGDLGYFTKTQMVAPFANAAFAMKIGEVRLVKSQFGWHIIKVTGREHTKLSASELQNAQTNSLQTWLQKESAALHVERLMSVTSLTDLATPVATAPVAAASTPAVAPTVATARLHTTVAPRAQPTRKP